MNKTLTLKPVDSWDQYYGIAKDFYVKLGGVDKIITEERKLWTKTCDAFLTNDETLKKIKPLKILLLKEDF